LCLLFRFSKAEAHHEQITEPEDFVNFKQSRRDDAVLVTVQLCMLLVSKRTRELVIMSL
jgi:hypothetical protein